MTTRSDDLRLLAELLSRDELSDEEREAFGDMLRGLEDEGRIRLSIKQRAWVASKHDEHFPKYENLVSNGLCPRGREVETPNVLKPENLPKKPPKRCGFCRNAACSGECL